MPELEPSTCGLDAEIALARQHLQQALHVAEAERPIRCSGRHCPSRPVQAQLDLISRLVERDARLRAVAPALADEAAVHVIGEALQRCLRSAESLTLFANELQRLEGVYTSSSGSGPPLLGPRSAPTVRALLKRLRTFAEIRAQYGPGCGILGLGTPGHPFLLLEDQPAFARARGITTGPPDLTPESPPTSEGSASGRAGEDAQDATGVGGTV